MMGVYRDVYQLLNKSDSEPIEASHLRRAVLQNCWVLNLNNSLKQQILIARSEK
jgi:hypothetical protein